MILYRLLSTREGRKRSEFPVGELHFREEQCCIEVPDRSTLKALQALFGATFAVRVDGGSESTLAHGWVELEPGSVEHFQEGLRRLLGLSLVAVEED